MDMPISGMACIFRAFKVPKKAKPTTDQLNRALIDFYATYAEPQNEVWPCIPIKNILNINREDLFEKWFYNYKFVVVRGTEEKEFVFTLANLPLMNPNDWILIYYILMLNRNHAFIKEISHIQLMILIQWQIQY